MAGEAHGELGSPEAPGGVEPPSFSGPTRHPLSKGVNHPDHPAPSWPTADHRHPDQPGPHTGS